VRDTVIASSNANAAVSFSAGTKDVVNDVPAASQLYVAAAVGTDNLALRTDGNGNKVQGSALVIDDTTARLSRSGNGGIPLQGTNTNDSPAAGDIGELLVATGSGVSLTTATAANICSITLTPGDWDVSGQCVFNGAGATVTSNITLSHSTTSATQDATVGKQQSFRFNGGSGFADMGFGVCLMPYRYSVTANTTVYLVGTATFTTSTYQGTGRIAARRLR
jgi:hypothetical protein